MGSWRRMAGDRRGASAVEFALLAPVLGMFVVGIVDLSRGLHRQFELEQATYRALELVTVGSLRSNYDYLKPEVATTLGIPQEDVAIEYWLECDGVRKQSVDEVCASPQQTARFVRLSARAAFRPSFSYGPLRSILNVGSNGSVPLAAMSTLRVQ